MRFSPSTRGWYPESIDYKRLPDDLVNVPAAIYAELCGKAVEVGPDGMPRAPAVVPPAAPASVTMRQARLALLHAEKLGMIEMALSGLESPQREAAQIEWEFAATVERASPLVVLLAGALGMTDDELDQLFMLASTL